LVLQFFSCSKDSYYVDGGRANASFDGSMMDYLDANPRQFDTIAQIVRLAGLEDEFKNQEMTFFAPSDINIKKLIGRVGTGGINNQLFTLGRDTIRDLADVNAAIWRKYVLRHLFLGKKKLADYSQIDYDLLHVFGGQNYISLGNTVCKIGVVFNDVKDGTAVLKYMGYRQLNVSYIADITRPNSFTSIAISSSDQQPKNGVIHILDYRKGQLGYRDNEITDDIIESKR